VLAETRQLNTDLILAQLRTRSGQSRTCLGPRLTMLLLAPPGSVLKTSAAPARRAASHERYEQGTWAAPADVWWQLTRLTLTSVLPRAPGQTEPGWCPLCRLCLGALWGGVAGGVGIIALLPRRSWCRAVARATVRLLLRLSGMPLIVRGLNTCPSWAYVVAVNHASYLDGPIVRQLFRSMCITSSSGNWRRTSRRAPAPHWRKFIERFEGTPGCQDTEHLLWAVQQVTHWCFS
jgi:hypothetical protein